MSLWLLIRLSSTVWTDCSDIEALNDFWSNFVGGYDSGFPKKDVNNVLNTQLINDKKFHKISFFNDFIIVLLFIC